MTLAAAPRPGGATSPQPFAGGPGLDPDPYQLRFLTAEERQTAVLMGFYQQARLDLEDFIRVSGDLTDSDAVFYRQLLDETNRLASRVNAQGSTWTSQVIPDAYSAGWRQNSSVVVPRRALEALSRDTLSLIRETTDGIRQVVRNSIAAGILEGLPADQVRARILASGLSNIPHWPTVEYRAGVIARTETMRAYNAGNLAAIEENGARYAEWIASPDEATCAICGPRDGKIFRVGAGSTTTDLGDADEVMALSRQTTDAYNRAEQLRIRAANARNNPSDPVHKEYADAIVEKGRLDRQMGDAARAYRERTGQRIPRPPEGTREAVVYDRFARIEDALAARGISSGWTGHVSVVDKYGAAASVTRSGNLYVASQQLVTSTTKNKFGVYGTDLKNVVDMTEGETLPTFLHEAMHATSPGFTTPKPGSISTGTKAIEEGIAENYARALHPAIAKDLDVESTWATEAYDTETSLLERFRASVGRDEVDFYGELHSSTDRFGTLSQMGIDGDLVKAWEAAGYKWG